MFDKICATKTCEGATGLNISILIIKSDLATECERARECVGVCVSEWKPVNSHAQALEWWRRGRGSVETQSECVKQKPAHVQPCPHIRPDENAFHRNKVHLTQTTTNTEVCWSFYSMNVPDACRDDLESDTCPMKSVELSLLTTGGQVGHLQITWDTC